MVICSVCTIFAAGNIENAEIMETTGTIQRQRTREEIQAWLDRARQRKLAWERRMQKKLEEEALLRKQAEESHYYDIAL